MTGILAKIVAERRRQIDEASARSSPTDLRASLSPSARDFAGAIAAARPAWILECKQASPSQGLIRSPFDVREIALAYAPVATCISVLCEPHWFQGDFAHLRQVRDLAPQPLLCKDFIIDPWQIWQARAHGADAVLLMLSVLDDGQYRALAQEAAVWNMAVLTEVSHEAEAARALRLGARVVGINNRDLRDLSIDLQRTPQLAGWLRRHSTATSRPLLISESGIRGRADWERLRTEVDGFLIGSELMRRPDLSAALHEWFGPVAG